MCSLLLSFWFEAHVPSSRSSSPFWKPKPPNAWRTPTKVKGFDPNVPIGAAYSHTDMLKYDDM